MKRILLFSLFLVGGMSLQAQYVEVAYGASYTDQVFYTLSDDNKVTVKNSDWDIAISTGRDAAIHLNEGAGSQETVLELFYAPVSDFADPVDTSILTYQLYNEDKTWAAGAFNELSNPDNPFDFGWGVYDPMTHAVTGQAVFGMKMRNGTWKKMIIESLISNVYTVKIADIDGSNESTLTFNLADYSDRNFIFYSFENDEVVDISDDFDLLFTRYYSPAPDGSGGFLDYSVSGVLSGMGVEVAQADGVDLSTVAFDDFRDSLSPNIDVIGYDWKDIDLGTFAWAIKENRAYFVKTASEELWKVVFIDFEGSSTGNTVFEKTFIGALTNINDAQSSFESFNVFPNPVLEEANVAFTLKEAANIEVMLTSVLGHRVWSNNFSAVEGLNVSTLPDLDLPAGTYFLNLRTEEGDLISKKISIQ